jgi:hypothetical protein
MTPLIKLQFLKLQESKETTALLQETQEIKESTKITILIFKLKETNTNPST